MTFHTRSPGAARTEGSDSQRHIVYVLPPLAASETEPFLTGRLLLLFFPSLPPTRPSVQKSDHGQVLLDVVFKHLELTERDYFGLHLADDSLDTPVSTGPSSERGEWSLCRAPPVFLSTMVFVWPLVNNSSASCCAGVVPKCLCINILQRWLDPNKPIRKQLKSR